MDRQLLERLNSHRAARRAALVLTDLANGSGLLVEEGGTVPPPLEQAVASAFRTGRSGLVEAEGRRWFVNVYMPPPRLVVIGAVHISQALAPMAKLAGYTIEIIDPRTAFATAERFPDTPLYAEWPEDVLKRQPLDAYAAVAALTHDPKIDDVALQEALAANCFYVGALGSRKTHAKRIERLQALGIAPESIARIDAPIGIDIAAATPSEIAVAVLAQIIKSFRSRSLEANERKSAA